MSGKKFNEVIYWNLCEKDRDIKVNKSINEWTVFRQHIHDMRNIFYMGTQGSAKQRRELFCKPFAQMGYNRTTAGHNWSHWHSLLMKLRNIIEIWKLSSTFKLQTQPQVRNAERRTFLSLSERVYGSSIIVVPWQLNVSKVMCKKCCWTWIIFKCSENYCGIFLFFKTKNMIHSPANQ